MEKSTALVSTVPVHLLFGTVTPRPFLYVVGMCRILEFGKVANTCSESNQGFCVETLKRSSATVEENAALELFMGYASRIVLPNWGNSFWTTFVGNQHKNDSCTVFFLTF